MAATGIKITQLNNILNVGISSSDVLPIVDVETDITNKITVQQIGTFILSNVAPIVGANLGDISNITIRGGSSGFVLSTIDGLGNLAWVPPDLGATGATGPAGTIGVDGSTGATGPEGPIGATGPVIPYIFDGGDPTSTYFVGPAFDCGGVT